MRANYFRSFGIITLLLDLLWISFAINDLSTVELSLWQSVRMLVSIGAITLVGFGLLFLRKWAALYFSIPLFLVGLWLFWASIAQVPFPWNLLFMCEGLSLMLPLVVTIRVWPELTWGGKWFI